VGGGEGFGEAADEALAGGGVGYAAGQAGGDWGFVVGGADVAGVCTEDEGDGVE
jgi:hypothetical protein